MIVKAANDIVNKYRDKIETHIPYQDSKRQIKYRKELADVLYAKRGDNLEIISKNHGFEGFIYIVMHSESLERFICYEKDLIIPEIINNDFTLE